jgi:hypothetical protein
MTAEVAVMNRLAVALAADSAVTLGGSAVGAARNLKIYYTANKLFSLSKYHPVGVMVYGNADLQAFPWETLIKEFRRKLGTRSRASVKQYGEAFIDFFNGNPHFDKKNEDTYFRTNVGSLFLVIKGEVDEKVKAHIDTKGGISESEVKGYLKSCIQANLEPWTKADFLPRTSQRDVNRLMRDRRTLLDEIRAQMFEKLPLDSFDVKMLNLLAASSFFKDRFRRSTSGVVVAGFGADELFPSLIVYNVEGVIQGRPKYKQMSFNKVDPDNEALVYPFAQKEMVNTFMEGIDPEISRYVLNYLQEVLDNYPERIVDSIPCPTPADRTQVLENLKNAGAAMFKDFQDSFRKFVHKSHVAPIIDIVSSLPKNELAEMAEALVNLTSVKRRMSPDAETVGGPVDVALISKGDGFVWIKRKHYFRPELNQHFFSNYFSESRQVSRRRRT